MKALNSFIFLIVILIGILSGCSHGKYSGFNPKDEEHSAVVFGFVRVFQDGKEKTEGAFVTLDNGKKLELDSNGFLPFSAFPGRARIIKITLSSGADYNISNMSMRVGPARSKTYFGHVVISIASNKGGALGGERWTWQATNRWKEAWAYWKHQFGSDKRKSYAAIAERTNKEKVQTRAIATDRQQVETGF